MICSEVLSTLSSTVHEKWVCSTVRGGDFEQDPTRVNRGGNKSCVKVVDVQRKRPKKTKKTSETTRLLQGREILERNLSGDPPCNFACPLSDIFG
jgi:hypothetical protein